MTFIVLFVFARNKKAGDKKICVRVCRYVCVCAPLSRINIVHRMNNIRKKIIFQVTFHARYINVKIYYKSRLPTR